MLLEARAFERAAIQDEEQIEAQQESLRQSQQA